MTGDHGRMPSRVPMCRTSNKRCYRSLQAAKVEAKIFAQELARRRQVSQNLYAYECRSCDSWHLTRMASYNGRESTLVFIAVDPEIQKWGWR